MKDEVSPPRLEFTLDIRVAISAPIEVGQVGNGLRRAVPISGGTFRGPLIGGRVLAGGADWQVVETDGLTIVDARYVLEADDGTKIEVHNRGIRESSTEVMNRIFAGEFVPAHEYYFRTTPRFYPPIGKYEWLRRSVFLGVAERYADLVIVHVWRVF